MDKQQAQFILQSFRPNGSDVVDSDFAEALRLATENSDLGEWLARERAEDAAFASALSSVEIPSVLREQIIDVMEKDQVQDIEDNDALDELFIDAMGEIQPPRGLRDEILTAMLVEQDLVATQSVTQARLNKVSRQKNLGSQLSSVVAIAAALVIGVFLAYKLTPLASSPDALFKSHEVQHHAENLLNASFEYDVKEDDPERIRAWLTNHQLPTPNTLPKGIQKLSCNGCKEITLPGAKKASMVCFSEQAGPNLYLIIVSNADIRDQGLPAISEVSVNDCYHCKVTKCDVARWRDAQNTYILFKQTHSEHQGELISYF